MTAPGSRPPASARALHSVAAVRQAGIDAARWDQPGPALTWRLASLRSQAERLRREYPQAPAPRPA